HLHSGTLEQLRDHHAYRLFVVDEEDSRAQPRLGRIHGSSSGYVSHLRARCAYPSLAGTARSSPGSTSVTDVPRPGSLSSETQPWCIRAIAVTIESPSPVPAAACPTGCAR